jgi:hypothetical protein
MSTLQQKADLVTMMNEQSQSPGLRAAVSLLDILIQEGREKNDDDPPEQVPINQGEIRAYKNFKKLILEGFQVPAPRQVKTY